MFLPTLTARLGFCLIQQGDSMRVVAYLISMPLFVLGACSADNGPSGAIYRAKDAVRQQMKDSGSAEFQDLEVQKLDNGRLAVCGSVNGKNSFGALAGYQRFYHVDGGATIMADTAPADLMDGLWQTAGCGGLKQPLARSSS